MYRTSHWFTSGSTDRFNYQFSMIVTVYFMITLFFIDRRRPWFWLFYTCSILWNHKEIRLGYYIFSSYYRLLMETIFKPCMLSGVAGILPSYQFKLHIIFIKDFPALRDRIHCRAIEVFNFTINEWCTNKEQCVLFQQNLQKTLTSNLSNKWF